MCNPLVQVASTAALFLALAVAGCERSPAAGSGSKPVVAREAAEARPAAIATRAVTTSQATEVPRKFVAYYFHRTIRCATCLSIEKQSQEALEVAYNAELSSGQLEWHAVNIEEPGNEHFEKDFTLERQALTLVELLGDKVLRHKKLERVWDLVEDPYGFQEYVVTEVARFLGGG